MFEHTPSARVQVVGRGDMLHPGTCMLCGSGNCEEGYVNLGVYYDYEGQMYLCHTCTIQVAEVIGCLIPTEAQFLRDTVAVAISENEALKETLEAGNERLRAFDLLMSTRRVNLADGDVPGSISSITIETGKGSEPDQSIMAEQVTDADDVREPEVTEPPTVEGHSKPKRVKLRDNASGDNKLQL